MALSNIHAHLPNSIKSIPPWTAVSVGAATGSVYCLVRSLYAYSYWRTLGRGGVPFNYVGWLIQAGLKLVMGRSDTAETSYFGRLEVREPYKPNAVDSFLDIHGEHVLPVRRGERPDVPYFFAPQRQMNEQADQARVDQMKLYLEAVVRSNLDQLQIKSSNLEGTDTSSIFLRNWDEPSRKPRFSANLKGEITHVHPEGSSHMTFSLHDASEVIRKGWGERHVGSGSAFGLPWTYVLVYAPRDDEEYAQWKKLVLASCSCWVSTVNGKKTLVICH